jgi:hypothetical protein
LSDKASVLIPAPGWAAVYVRDGNEFAWPLIAWLGPANSTGPVLVGLTLRLDGRMVVRADEIEGFKCYLPPAEWITDSPGDPPAPDPSQQ